MEEGVTEYYDSKILPEVAVVYDFGASAGLVMPKIEYQPTVNTSIVLGAVWLFC